MFVNLLTYVFYTSPSYSLIPDQEGSDKILCRMTSTPSWIEENCQYWCHICYNRINKEENSQHECFSKIIKRIKKKILLYYYTYHLIAGQVSIIQKEIQQTFKVTNLQNHLRLPVISYAGSPRHTEQQPILLKEDEHFF